MHASCAIFRGFLVVPRRRLRLETETPAKLRVSGVLALRATPGFDPEFDLDDLEATRCFPREARAAHFRFKPHLDRAHAKSNHRIVAHGQNLPLSRSPIALLRPSARPCENSLSTVLVSATHARSCVSAPLTSAAFILVLGVGRTRSAELRRLAAALTARRRFGRDDEHTALRALLADAKSLHLAARGDVGHAPRAVRFAALATTLHDGTSPPQVGHSSQRSRVNASPHDPMSRPSVVSPVSVTCSPHTGQRSDCAGRGTHSHRVVSS